MNIDITIIIIVDIVWGMTRATIAMQTRNGANNKVSFTNNQSYRIREHSLY